MQIIGDTSRGFPIKDKLDRDSLLLKRPPTKELFPKYIQFVELIVSTAKRKHMVSSLTISAFLIMLPMPQ